MAVPGQYSPFDIYAASQQIQWRLTEVSIDGKLVPSDYYNVPPTQSHFRFFQFTQSIDDSETVTVKLSGGAVTPGAYTASFLVVANVTSLVKRNGVTFTLVVSTVVSEESASTSTTVAENASISPTLTENSSPAISEPTAEVSPPETSFETSMVTKTATLEVYSGLLSSVPEDASPFASPSASSTAESSSGEF